MKDILNIKMKLKRILITISELINQGVDFDIIKLPDGSYKLVLNIDIDL